MTCTSLVSGSVVKLMPFDGDCYEYRIKSLEEPFVRVAKEHELREEEFERQQEK